MADPSARPETIDELVVAQATFTLGRPSAGKAPVRAWDAGDEYVLDFVAGLDRAVINQETGSTVIVNDDFGALGTALAYLAPVSLGDSCISQRCLNNNLRRNGLDPTSVDFVASLGDLPDQVDLVLVKVPKTLALLEHQLHRLRPLMHAGTVVVGAGMTRHIHTSTIELFERIIGPTTTSLARKKARLIHAKVEHEPASASPWPKTLNFEGHVVISHAGVFSSNRIDPASEMLIKALRTHPLGDGTDITKALDLGCGNGVLGLAVSLAHPEAALHFTDVSYLAVESARKTWDSAWGTDRNATFEVSDGLAAISDVDLIVNNPPFHEGHLRGDEIAWRMFADSHRVLRRGGELLVVGNRHLGYHTKLKRRFGNCETVLSDKKFVVLRAVR